MMKDLKLNLRSATLARYGANDSEIEELLVYNQNRFGRPRRSKIQADPAYIDRWREYAEEARHIGAFASLKQRLVQLQFPIQAGISNTPEYLAATGKGKPTQMSVATGLQLTFPERIELKIQPTEAGAVPIITVGDRQDFVSLIQALTKCNEPVAIPDSMEACIVGSYNNWDRIACYRQQWLAEGGDRAHWQSELKRLIPRKELYQDRFIVLSRGCYSSVSADELGLDRDEWLELSQIIRLEHECTHYFTRRVFGSMRNNIFDELIADYQGIVSALGYYRADWFLRFIGLEAFPKYRLGGRLENYYEPSLSSGAIAILQKAIVDAATNLEEFDREVGRQLRANQNKTAILLALCKLTLEELASTKGVTLLKTKVTDRVEQSAAVFSRDIAV